MRECSPNPGASVHRSRDIGCKTSHRLLHDVSELVGQETTAITRVRSESARVKHDVIADGECLCRVVARGILGLAAGVQSHVGQIVIEVRGHVLLKMGRRRSARCRDHKPTLPGAGPATLAVGVGAR